MNFFSSNAVSLQIVGIVYENEAVEVNHRRSAIAICPENGLGRKKNGRLYGKDRCYPSAVVI